MHTCKFAYIRRCVEAKLILFDKFAALKSVNCYERRSIKINGKLVSCAG